MMLKWSLATDMTNVGQINHIILDHIVEFQVFSGSTHKQLLLVFPKSSQK